MDMEKGKILVTPRSLSKHGHPLLEQFTKAGYQVVYPSPGVQPGEEELIENADRVVGIDNIDLAAAEEHEVKVLKAVGANSRGVAELAFGMNVIAYDPFPDPRFQPGKLFEFTDFPTLIEKSDAVSLHCPSSKVRSFTCDVFAVEPPDDWSLAKHARVLGTPHIGGFTQESVHRAARTAIENLLVQLEGFIAG